MKRLRLALPLLCVLGSLAPFVRSFGPSRNVRNVSCRSCNCDTTTSRLFDQSQPQQSARPFGIMVQAEIEPDRMGEFMELMEQNAVKSRQEPGCLRFDVLRSDDSETTFFFYEVYQNPDAVEEHKKQDHYKKWAAFKESGGTVSSRSFKLHGEFMT